MITVRGPSGLAVPFEPPEVTSEAAIERSWTIPDGGRLLEAKRREYLPTTPCTPVRGYAGGIGPAWTSPSFVLGLPAL